MNESKDNYLKKKKTRKNQKHAHVRRCAAERPYRGKLPKGRGGAPPERQCPLVEHLGWSEGNCDCHKVDVKGMHECHYKYILDTLWRPHYLPGDAQICDLLSSHFNNFSLDYFLEKKVWMLPMYSKTAPENSVLDAGGFAIAILANFAQANARDEAKAERIGLIGGFTNCSVTMILTFCAGVEAFSRLFLAPHIFEQVHIGEFPNVPACTSELSLHDIVAAPFQPLMA